MKSFHFCPAVNEILYYTGRASNSLSKVASFLLVYCFVDAPGENASEKDDASDNNDDKGIVN